MMQHISKSNETTLMPESLGTSKSGIQLSDKKRLKKQADDLTWQIKFSQMKLKSWRNPDEMGWGPLEDLLKTAKSEAVKLGLN